MNMISAYLIDDDAYKRNIRDMLVAALRSASKIIVHWQENVNFPELRVIRVITKDDTYRFDAENDSVKCNNANRQEKGEVLQCIRYITGLIDQTFKIIQRHDLINMRSVMQSEVLRLVKDKLMTSSTINFICKSELMFPYHKDYALDELPPPILRIDSYDITLDAIQGMSSYNDLCYLLDGVFTYGDHVAALYY